MRETLELVSPTVPEGADKGLLTVTQLAAYLSVSDKTLRQWVAQNKIPHGRLENNIRFDRDQIQEWLDSRWKQADSKPEDS
ncbi:MAG: helix-turn-helix domain-containing protein [Actinomycetota bacterium]|nr:helix-turn-helix domain-containing protein [Actinomycetota bacterium]